MEHEELVHLLKTHAPPDTQTLPGGTIRIGHVPIVAPLAYLHSIHPPLTDEDLLALDAELPVPLPRHYRAFLRVTNGLALFVTSISLYGSRRGTARDLSALDEPHSILSGNLEYRSKELGKDALVIGSYDEDHSLVTMRSASATVTCTTPDGATVRATWPDLGTFIRDEVSRLHTLLAPGFAGLCLGTFTRKVPGELLKGDLTEADFSRPWWRFW